MTAPARHPANCARCKWRLGTRPRPTGSLAVALLSDLERMTYRTATDADIDRKAARLARVLELLPRRKA